MEMSRLTRDGTAEPVSRDQILRHERGQGNIHFSCSADHEQDWQLTQLIHTLAICVTIHTSSNMVVIKNCCIGCKDKATTWSPMVVVTMGEQYNVGENPTVILYTYINRHVEPPNTTKQKTL